MARPRVLILYGTRYGQTAKIAAKLAGMLDELGYEPDLHDAAEVPPDLPLAGSAGVIVAASVIMGRHQKSVERFVREQREELNRLPSAFLSVSGAAGSKRPDGRTTARRQLELFLRRTGWTPRHTQCVAGAISYTEYSPLVRWMIRTIMARQSGPTETSRDHEFTDWERLRGFAAEFTSLIPREEEVPVAPAAPVAPVAPVDAVPLFAGTS